MQLRASIFFLLAAFAACHPKKRPEPLAPDAAELAEEPCTANQFVPCPTGEACARRHGKLIRAHACFDQAAKACEAAGCVHGCDVHHGDPKEIHCAINASSTGHMKKCGGFSNWGCPENMTCEFTPEAQKADDALGTCVVIAGAAK